MDANGAVTTLAGVPSKDSDIAPTLDRGCPGRP